MTEVTNDKMMVGILAYGSLISNPGAEVEKYRLEVIRDVATPFAIEFARSSTGRGGAPTLVPVAVGGAQVKGQVFVMGLSEAATADVLYRREIGKVGKMERTFKRPTKVTDNTVLVERLMDFAGLDVVFYTKIAATIDPLTAKTLADLAIASVSNADPGCDGVSYLKAAKESGIVTALSPSYEDEILRKTACRTLDEALAKLQG